LLGILGNFSPPLFFGIFEPRSSPYIFFLSGIFLLLFRSFLPQMSSLSFGDFVDCFSLGDRLPASTAEMLRGDKRPPPVSFPLSSSIFLSLFLMRLSLQGAVDLLLCVRHINDRRVFLLSALPHFPYGLDALSTSWKLFFPPLSSFSLTILLSPIRCYFTPSESIMSPKTQAPRIDGAQFVSYGL